MEVFRRKQACYWCKDRLIARELPAMDVFRTKQACYWCKDRLIARELPAMDVFRTKQACYWCKDRLIARELPAMDVFRTKQACYWCKDGLTQCIPKQYILTLNVRGLYFYTNIHYTHMYVVLTIIIKLMVNR